MKDPYTRKAQKENYYARSVYKLKEINNKYKIIKKDYKILDIGCSPGSWSQYALEKTGEKGTVTGMDLNKPKIKAKNFTFTKADIRKSPKLPKDFNTVLSDISPKTTGIKNLDQELSHELAEQSLKIALKTLKQNGNFLVKVFQSNQTKNLLNKIKKHFKTARIIKPKASKPKSKEIYILGKNKI